jgi:hypothetical protein
VDGPEEGDEGPGIRVGQAVFRIVPVDGVDEPHIVQQAQEDAVRDVAQVVLDASCRVLVGGLVVPERVPVREPEDAPGVVFQVLVVAVEDLVPGLEEGVHGRAAGPICGEPFEGAKGLLGELPDAPNRGAVDGAALVVLHDEGVGERGEDHLSGFADVGGDVGYDGRVPADTVVVLNAQIVFRRPGGRAELAYGVVCHCIFPDLSGPDDEWRNLGTPRESRPAAGMRLCSGCCSAGDLRMLVLYFLLMKEDVRGLPQS